MACELRLQLRQDRTANGYIFQCKQLGGLSILLDDVRTVGDY